jgi:hypothetical protein
VRGPKAAVAAAGARTAEDVVTLAEILASRRSSILRRWLESVLTTWPPETARFLRDEPDPFRNPVGHALRETLDDLFTRLLAPPRSDACPPLDRFMRVQAVQGRSASCAVGFVLMLKKIVHTELTPHLGGPATVEELLALDERVDLMALLAFDLFAESREQITTLQAQEVQRRTAKLVERLQKQAEQAGQGKDE